MWAGEAAIRKSVPALRQAGYESSSDLPRITSQKSYREKALAMTTTSNEDECKVVQRENSSGVNFGSARSVTQTATA